MEKKEYSLSINNGSEVVEKIIKRIGDQFGETIIVRKTIGECTLISMVCEKYYFRNNSAASMSISFFVGPNETEIYAISSGAGTGLFNISMGATSKSIQYIDDIFVSMGLM